MSVVLFILGMFFISRCFWVRRMISVVLMCLFFFLIVFVMVDWIVLVMVIILLIDVVCGLMVLRGWVCVGMIGCDFWWFNGIFLVCVVVIEVYVIWWW